MSDCGFFASYNTAATPHMHGYARYTVMCDFSISALAYYKLFVAVSTLAIFNLMSVSSTSVAGVFTFSMDGFYVAYFT